MNRGRPVRRIRNFFLDAKFQLHYMLQMVGVSAALTFGLGALVYHFNAEASRVLEVGVLDEETARMVHEQYASGQLKLVMALCGFGALLCLVLAAWQVVTTHKLAGPIYYMKRELKKIRDGRFGHLHPLRKGDLLHDFFDVFAATHEAMRQRAEREASQLAALAAQADQSGQSAIADALRGLQKEREESLK